MDQTKLKVLNDTAAPGELWLVRSEAFRLAFTILSKAIRFPVVHVYTTKHEAQEED